jgi:uncharacterized protein YndB with AHSA1/START domain
MKSAFVYTSYIKTSSENLWIALTSPKFIKLWWGGGIGIKCDWNVGSSWTMNHEDGRISDVGEILEINPPQRVVIKWRNESSPELKEEGFSRCIIELEQMDGAVKLTVTHGINIPNSKFIEAVSVGWPLILSNLKSLLETGEVVLKERTEGYGRSKLE